MRELVTVSGEHLEGRFRAIRDSRGSYPLLDKDSTSRSKYWWIGMGVIAGEPFAFKTANYRDTDTFAPKSFLEALVHPEIPPDRRPKAIDLTLQNLLAQAQKGAERPSFITIPQPSVLDDLPEVPWETLFGNASAVMTLGPSFYRATGQIP